MTAIIDVETDSTDSNVAKLKYFGGLDCDTGEVTMLPYTANIQITDYIKKHKVLIGFNLKGYDVKVLENYGVSLKYKVIVDLYEALAPPGDNGYGAKNKDRLSDINPGLKFMNYKLKTIIQTLDLDDEGKGEIDYNIFKKDEWDNKEKEEIEKYLKQDLLIEHKLFQWYRNIFKPLEKYLKKEDVDKCKHLTCKSGGLAYKFVCSRTAIQEEYSDSETASKLRKESPRIEGGHHIHPRWEKVRGNIICRDFVSHYPTILVGYQLHKQNVNDAIELILNERLEAKAKKDKVTALALKVPLNSIYGICGNVWFKNVYNPIAALECTRIGRELLKRYAMSLDVAGFIPLYGFTDSVYVGIPKGLSDKDLNVVTDYFIEQTKKEFVKPLDNYGLGIDKVLKFMWFIDKKDNNYLTVDKDNKVNVKGALFDKNTPSCITELFETYIKPKIINDLDVNFKEEELLNELNKILKDNPELSAQDYSCKELSTYKLKTSLNAQISERYGPGVHSLIPNTAGVGVGRNDKLKYCSLEDFNEHNLSFEQISIDRMKSYIKPFYSTKEDVLDLEKIK